MKRKTLSLLFFMFFGLFLVGCDFFGGGTTTIITTAATTTQATTAESSATTTEPGVTTTTAGTTAVTTATTTAATTATTTAATTATTTAATTATTTAATTATTTAATTATTTAATTATTTVSTTTVTTVTTSTVEQVSVTFLNGDGTILYVATIVKGTNAIAPANPTMLETADYTFTFLHWDHDLIGINDNIMVRAVYNAVYKHASSEFNREDLLALVQSMSDEVMTTEEIEAEIAKIMEMTGIESEEHLYALMSQVPDLLAALMGVTTLEEFETWYASTKTAGFTEELIVNALIKALTTQLRYGVEYFDISYIDEEIAEYQEMIDINNGLMSEVRTNVVTYCETYTSSPGDCINFYDRLVQDLGNQMVYDQVYNNYFNSVDYENSEKYYQLQNLMDEHLYYKYQTGGETEAATYLSDYNALLGTLSPELQLAFSDIIAAFVNWIESEHLYTDPLRETLDMIVDTTEDHWIVRNRIEWSYFGDHQYLFWENHGHYWSIQDCERERERMLQQHEIMSMIHGYLQTPAGLANVRELIMTFYDVADSLILNIDQDIFDLFMEIMNDPEGFNPETLLTPANIALYVSKIVDILELIQVKFDVDAMANLQVIGQDFLTLYIQHQDMTAVEKAALLTLILPKVEEYLGIAEATFDNILGFLGSIDEGKAEAIINAVMMLMGDNSEENNSEPLEMDETEYVQMMWTIANLINVLIGDESLDVSALIDDFIDIYYDVTTFFEPDEELKAAVKTAVIANVTRIIELAAIIAAYDPMAIDGAGIIAIEEFMARCEAFGAMFEYGFESILEPIEFGYEHEDFLNLVYRLGDYDMTEEEAEQLIIDIMAIFEQTDEETTYYLIQTLMMHVMSVQAISSFSGLQTWIAAFDNYGFTRQDIAQISMNFILYNFNRQLAEGGHFDTEEDYFNNQIDMYEGMIIDYQGEIDELDTYILSFLSGLDQTLIDDYMTYWQTRKLESAKLIDIKIALNNIMYSSNSFDYWRYSSLSDCLYNIYLGDNIQDDFDSLWNALSEEEQMMYGPVLDKESDYYAWKAAVYDPLIDAFDLSLYDSTGVNNYFWNTMYLYQAYYHDIYYIQDWIMNEYENLEYLAKDRLRSEFMLAYLNDPVNQLLTKNVMLIGMDEIFNVISVADPETFDIFVQLLRGQMFMGPSIMIEEPGFDPSFIDLSPEAILGYVQDISAVIGTLFSTIDETEAGYLKAFLFDMIEIQFEVDGMSEVEIAATMAIVDLAIDKYYPRIEGLLTILTDTLNGLTVTEIETIMNLVTNMAGQENSTVQIIVAVSTLIDILCYDETLEIADTLDYETLINYAVELYFDIIHMFEYDPLVMAALQTVVLSYAEDMLAYAHEIAAFDPAALTDDDIAVIFAAYKLGQYIGMNFQDFENLVYPAQITLTYEHQDFVNLIKQMHGDWMTEAEIEEEIQIFMDIFETTDEETAFFRLFMLGSMVRGIQDIYSFSDFIGFYHSIQMTGYSNADLATYLINFAVLQMDKFIADNYEYELLMTIWPADIIEYEDEIAADLVDIATIDATVEAEIATLALANPLAAGVASQMYAKGIEADQYKLIMEQLYNEAYWNEEVYFNDSLYQELEFYWVGDWSNDHDPGHFDSIFDYLREEEQSLYMPVLLAATDFWTAIREYADLGSTLWGYGVYASTSAEFGYYLDSQLNERSFYTSDILYCNGWLEETLANIEMTTERLKMALMFQEFFSDPDYVILAKEALTLIMDRLDAVLEGLSEEQIMKLKEVFSEYYFDFDEYTTPEEIVVKMQNLMILFGPIFVDASGTYYPDSTLCEMLNGLIASYAIALPIPVEGWTTEDFRLDVQMTVFNFIDLMHLINTFDAEMLYPGDILRIEALITYIQDFGNLFSHNDREYIE